MKYTIYHLVANQGGRYTKHIYIGGERIVSKIGDFDSYGPDPRRIEYAGSEADAVTVDYDVKYSQQLQAIKNNYATFGVPYNGTDNDDYVNGEGFCCDDGSLEAAQAEAVAQANALDGNFQEGDAYERLQFYYHADHLGSTSYITNLDGEVVQHIEYVPFGEVFIEERNNTWNTPYLFNAKEFDEETGLYYYGARYYDPRLNLWMSTDPMQEKYPNFSSLCYTFNNPLNFIDYYGFEPTDEEALAMAEDAYAPGSYKIPGNWRYIHNINNIGSGFQAFNEETGFKSALYGRYDDKTGTYTEYVYATAGTDFDSFEDWENNFKQLFGKSEQYNQSVNNARLLSQSKMISDKELTFVGHSLGGGLASANALATGNPAITFNAAALSNSTKKALNLFYKPDITAYIVTGEIVDYLQSLINMHAEGNRIYLPASYFPKIPFTHADDLIRSVQRINNHLISVLREKIIGK